MDRAARSGLIRGFGQLGQERLRFLLLPCAQILANLTNDLANALLALQIA